MGLLPFGGAVCVTHIAHDLSKARFGPQGLEAASWDWGCEKQSKKGVVFWPQIWGASYGYGIVQHSGSTVRVARRDRLRSSLRETRAMADRSAPADLVEAGAADAAAAEMMPAAGEAAAHEEEALEGAVEEALALQGGGGALGAAGVDQHLAQLRAEHAQLQAERKRVQGQIKVEERKRRRLMEKARNLSNEDLISILGARAAAKAKAQAKAKAKGKAKAKAKA